MSAITAPGLQYPGHLDESDKTDSAIRMIVDNLFYLRGIADNPTLSPAISAQVQKIVQQVSVTTGPATTASGLLIVGTHVERITIYGGLTDPVGTQFYETDRGLLYVIDDSTGVKLWKYIAGVMYALFANRPVDLGAGDVGALYIPSEHLHWCMWRGTAWQILDDDGGTFKESARALGPEYQVCDGTATTYLAISGADLQQVAITTPDEVTAPSGVYHNSIAVYTGVTNAAVAPGLSGQTADTTATNQAAATGVTVDPHTVVEITDVAGADDWAFDTQADADHTVNDPTHNHTQNAHHHAIGTLAVDATALPRTVGVLRYLRR